MNFSKIASSMLIVATVCAGTSSSASAADRTTRQIIKDAGTLAPQDTVMSRAKASFVGGWHGALLVQFNTCPVNAPRSIPFRHTLSLNGNRATLRTSHDGTLTGTSRDKGRRIETSRRMLLSNGVQASVGVVYQNLRGNVTGIGYAIEYKFGSSSCRIGYGGNGIRAF